MTRCMNVLYAYERLCTGQDVGIPTKCTSSYLCDIVCKAVGDVKKTQSGTPQKIGKYKKEGFIEGILCLTKRQK